MEMAIARRADETIIKYRRAEGRKSGNAGKKIRNGKNPSIFFPHFLTS
jgi:hypothetical protein